MKNKKSNKIKKEDMEREFWAKADLSKMYSAEDFEKVVFPNLKPTTRPISIRLPVYLINIVKEQANELNIPYQSLIKTYIKEGVMKSK
jgi:predicted DNA binding CopG/RHH family protein